MTRLTKDSGIKWIGEIPKEWEVKKLKYLGILSSNGVDKKIKEGQKLSKSVHYMDVYRNSLKEIGNGDDYLLISADDNKRISCQLKKGDVLFTNSSETPEDIGHSTVVKEDLHNTLFGYHLMRFRPGHGVELYYEKYLFGSYYIRKWFEYRAIGMTRYGLCRTDFNELLIILPSLVEQTRIASTLDRNCTKIDETIEMEKQVIEKLKSYKQSVITETVTKGLDPNVPMKDSGIQWIGEIPEHWEVCKLKYVSSIRSGDGIINEQLVENAIYDVWGGNGYMGKTNQYNVEGEKLIIGRVGALCGNVRFSNDEKFITDNALILDVHKTENSWFYYYLILSTNLGKLSTSNAQPLITGTKVLNIFIPSLKSQEQTAIATYLDAKCSKIDHAITQKESLIEKLTQYKKSLIYECVTGKREVHHVG